MMLYIACMHEIELPIICQEGQHSWSDMSTHGCGAEEGDQVLDEAIVIFTPVKNEKPGLTCSKCFQIYGKPQGTRNPNITIVYQNSKEWDLKQPQ
jgi:hypothetical protein